MGGEQAEGEVVQEVELQSASLEEESGVVGRGVGEGEGEGGAKVSCRLKCFALLLLSSCLFLLCRILR